MIPSPPDFYQQARQQYPDLFRAFEELGKHAAAAGPLDSKTVLLVKLALSVAAGLEGATHSATRKALASGCSPDELRHIVLLGVTTLGFPAMMRARSWVEDVLNAPKGA